MAEGLPFELRRLIAEDIPSVEACRRHVASLPRDALDRRDSLLAVKDDTRRARAALAYACIAAETKRDVASALQKAERTHVCTRTRRWTGITKVARLLMRVRGLKSLDEHLPRRLGTYLNLAEFIRTQQADIVAYQKAVRRRTPSMVRAAISVAAIACGARNRQCSCGYTTRSLNTRPSAAPGKSYEVSGVAISGARLRTFERNDRLEAPRLEAQRSPPARASSLHASRHRAHLGRDLLGHAHGAQPGKAGSASTPSPAPHRPAPLAPIPPHQSRSTSFATSAPFSFRPSTSTR